MFTGLEQTEIDPRSDALLEQYQRVRILLHDFLFQASRRMRAIRTEVDRLRSDPRNDARWYVFLSGLVRRFQSLQQAHHRFEFAAGELETPDNFRLDAALQSARGLFQRSQARIQEIENRLQRQAAEQARARYREDLRQTEEALHQARLAADEALNDLLALQRELNQSADLQEARLRRRMQEEVAAARLTITESSLADTRDVLKRLEAERLRTAEGRIELLAVEVDRLPRNLPVRLLTILLAAGAAFGFTTLRLRSRRTEKR